MEIPEWLLRQAFSHVADEFPNEGTGAILRRSTAGGNDYWVWRMTNVSANSRLEYSWAHDEMRAMFDHMEQHDMELWALYHSHPETAPEPSTTDESAAWYVGAHYLIFSLAGGREDLWCNSYRCVAPGQLVLEEMVIT